MHETPIMLIFHTFFAREDVIFSIMLLNLTSNGSMKIRDMLRLHTRTTRYHDFVLRKKRLVHNFFFCNKRFQQFSSCAKNLKLYEFQQTNNLHPVFLQTIVKTVKHRECYCLWNEWSLHYKLAQNSFHSFRVAGLRFTSSSDIPVLTTVTTRVAYGIRNVSWR